MKLSEKNSKRKKEVKTYLENIYKMQLSEEDFRESCALGNVDYAKKFIAQGININGQNKMNGWTALHWAAARDHPAIAKLLIDNGANQALKDKNERC